MAATRMPSWAETAHGRPIIRFVRHDVMAFTKATPIPNSPEFDEFRETNYVMLPPGFVGIVAEWVPNVSSSRVIQRPGLVRAPSGIYASFTKTCYRSCPEWLVEMAQHHWTQMVAMSVPLRRLHRTADTDYRFVEWKDVVEQNHKEQVLRQLRLPIGCRVEWREASTWGTPELEAYIHHKWRKFAKL